ncbi:MAG TPA: DUF4249 family protein [Chryseolinea sp.]|nr:DUF4249 family protein [Chryseolinea sp.]
MISRLFKNIIVSLLFSGCLTPIEVVTKRQGGDVVISGHLSSLVDESNILVGITAESQRLPFPVSGAVINLFQNGELIGAFVEDGGSPGKYLLSDIAGIPGKMYHVQVIFPDGRIYESTPEEMPQDAGSISTYYEFIREEVINSSGNKASYNYIQIYGNSVLPDASARYMRWSVDEVYIIVPTTPPLQPFTTPPCYITQSAEPQKLVLLDRERVNATEYNGQLLTTRLIDESFIYEHYFLSYQSVLSEDAYNYWTKVEELIEGNGSIFDAPPAIIPGNVTSKTDESERVFGYFQVINQALHRFSLVKTDLPFVLAFGDCQGNGPQVYPPRRWCIDCLTVKNSSNTRPPWF